MCDDYDDVFQMIQASDLAEEFAASLEPDVREIFWKCPENWKEVAEDESD